MRNDRKSFSGGMLKPNKASYVCRAHQNSTNIHGAHQNSTQSVEPTKLPPNLCVTHQNATQSSDTQNLTQFTWVHKIQPNLSRTTKNNPTCTEPIKNQLKLCGTHQNASQSMWGPPKFHPICMGPTKKSTQSQSTRDPPFFFPKFTYGMHV